MPKEATIPLVPLVQLPEDPQGALLALIDYIETLHTAISTVNASFFMETHVVPPKPLTNMIRLADGTNWNPGSGKGLYQYRGSSWNFLG